jgi:hypothetical protein
VAVTAGRRGRGQRLQLLALYCTQVPDMDQPGSTRILRLEQRYDKQLRHSKLAKNPALRGALESGAHVPWLLGCSYEPPWWERHRDLGCLLCGAPSPGNESVWIGGAHAAAGAAVRRTAPAK